MAMNRRAAVVKKLLDNAGYAGDFMRLAESLPPQTIAQFDKLLNRKEPSVGPGMDSGIVVAYKSGEVVQDRPMQGNFSKEGIAVYEDGGAVSPEFQYSPVNQRIPTRPEAREMIELGYSVLPFFGEASDFIEGASDVRRGDYTGAILSGIGFALPFVPAKALKKATGLAQDKLDNLPTREARENLANIVDANTIGGRVIGDETVSIDTLTGGAASSKRSQDAINEIAEQMRGPDGYIERLIVDQDGNVIEGAHRLEALRKLGITDVPITRIVDPTADLNVPAITQAIRGAGPINSDHVNQITAQVAEMLADVGGDPARVRAEYVFPQGFEKFFEAALQATSRKGVKNYEDGGAVERLITRDPRVEYSTVLPFGVLTEPDPAGSLLSEQRTVLTMPELVRGFIEGVAAPQQVYEGKMDPMTGAMLTAGAAPVGGLLARAPAGALGMNVFQGSPHRYGPEGAAKSLDHIGKGEGALAYGYGRYDAGSEKVGKKYRRDLNRGPAEVFVDGRAVTDFDTKTLNDPQSVGLSLVESMQRLRPHLSQDEIIDSAIKQGDTYIETYSLPGATADDLATAEGWRKGRDWLLKNKSRLSSAEGGYLYKHDIPDEDIARYLDWDKPLSEQPESVRAALESLGFKADPQGLRDYDEALLDALYNDPKRALPKLPADPTGAEIYQSLVDKSGALDWPVGSDRAAREAYRKSAKQAASEALGKAGIPGLKYYDGMSRNAGEGTRNYVTWDQDVLDRIKLLQRNDERFAEGGAVEPRSVDSEAEILAIYDLLDEENQKPERERDPERIDELYSRLTELQVMSAPPVALGLSEDVYLLPQFAARFGIGESNTFVPFFEDTVKIRDRNMSGIGSLGAEIGFPGFSGNDRLSGGVTGTYARTKRLLPDEFIAFGAPSKTSFGTRGIVPVDYNVNYSSGPHTFSGNVTPRLEGVSRDAPGGRSVLGLGYTYSETPKASYSLQATPFGRRVVTDPKTGDTEMDRSIMGRYTTRF